MADKKTSNYPAETNPTGKLLLDAADPETQNYKLNLGDLATDTFTTTSKTIMGAINELDGEIGTISAEYVKKDGDGTSQQVAGGETGGTLTLKAFNTDTKQVSISAGGFDTSYLIELDSSVNPNTPNSVPDNEYINSADRTLSGKWTVPSAKPPEYDVVPTLSNDKQLVPKKYVDDIIVEGVDENQIYYVRSGGSDTEDGKNIAGAFLTYPKAFTDVSAQTPSSTNQFAIKTNDGYVYDGSFDMTATTPNLTYTKIDAPSAVVRSNDATINDNCSIKLKQLTRLSGTGNVLTKKGSGNSYFEAETLENSLSAGNIFIDNGILHIKSTRITVPLITDTLVTGNAANTKKMYMEGDFIRGKIFTNNIGDEYWIVGKDVNIEISANASSKIHIICETFGGRLASAGALCEVDIICQKRTSSYATDATPALGAKIRIEESAKPYIHAYLSANLSAGVSTPTLVTFDTLEGAAYGFTLTGASGTITSLTQGVFEVEAGLAYDLSGTGQSREIIIYVNGAPLSKDTERQQGTGQDKQNSNIVNKIPLQKGDTVQIYAWSDANPAINVNGTATYKNQTYFKIAKIGNIA